MPSRRGGSKVEKRRDPNEKGDTLFTKAQFVEYYGEKKGTKVWDRAGEPAPAEGGKKKGKKEPEKRADPTESNGKTYTRQEFIECYGESKGTSLWDKAGSKKGGKEESKKGKREKRDRGEKKEKAEKKERGEEKEKEKEKEKDGKDKEKREKKPRRGTLTLYGNLICPFAQRALWACEEKKAKHEFVKVPLAGEIAQAEAEGMEKLKQWEGKTLEELKALKEDYMAKLNPTGEVPTVRFVNTEDEAKSGFPVVESEICAEFIDSTHSGKPKLIPAPSTMAARARIFVKRLSAKLIGPLYDLLRNQDPAKDAEMQEKIVAGCKWWAESMDEDGPYFFDRGLTLPDICMGPFMERFAVLLPHYRSFKLPGSVPGSAAEVWETRLEHWWVAVQKRPAFVASSGGQDLYLDAYLGYAKAKR
eukprot:TRINITY_DN7830_c2_g2_i3.p1 TRINITY_DN7830_c2_g2~~TRINITY_DN7830_c2_g2_i3.p1  ORF type:complete len:417 (+),score=182.15 TRINITY_DN7830_c2_g2_i3:530-1780(+)